jgi:hypothetical protein
MQTDVVKIQVTIFTYFCVSLTGKYILWINCGRIIPHDDIFPSTSPMILYRVGGTCRVYRLHHSVVHSLLLPTV